MKNSLFRFSLILQITVVGLFALTTNCGAKVLLGIDVLEKENFAPLKGKRVGLITNHTGIDGKGKRTIDILARAPGVKLTALFSPEHGIRGKKTDGEDIQDGIDSVTGIPVYSLYGKTNRPTADMMKGLDALVFDIQDIGTRFYTYTTTLAYALEEAAKMNIEFFVLDRPNPITGSIVEGETLDPKISHFTAYLQIPTRHGMTAGEIANYHNLTKELNARLVVTKMEGWKREMWWGDTGIPFRPTSPNIRNLKACLLYSGIGQFEATNVSVGRGTSKPFEIIGAPWINGEALAVRLTFLGVPGFKFQPVRFMPNDDIYKGEHCGGVKIIVTDRNEARPINLFVQMLLTLRDFYPMDLKVRWDEMERMAGLSNFKLMIEMGQSAESISFLMNEQAVKFEESRKPYLLYETK